MSETEVYTLSHQLARERAADAVRRAPQGYTVTIAEPKRSIPQNDLLHPLCRAVAKQCKWAGEYLDEDDWKRLFVAAVYGQKVVPTLEGTGFIALNRATSKMRKMEMAEVLGYAQAWAAEHGVAFDPVAA